VSPASDALAHVSIRQHTRALPDVTRGQVELLLEDSIRQHTSAYFSDLRVIRGQVELLLENITMDRLSVFVVKRMLPCQHTSAYVSILRICCYYVWWSVSFCGKTDAPLVSSPTHANFSKRQHTSAYLLSSPTLARLEPTSPPHARILSPTAAQAPYVSIRRNT
jgi:hypothetical protein